MKHFIKQWYFLKFNQQITISLSVILVIVITVVAFAVSVGSNYFFIQRGYDLLQITNRHSSEQLINEIERLNHKNYVCDTVAKEIKPYLLNLVVPENITNKTNIILKPNSALLIIDCSSNKKRVLSHEWISKLLINRTGLGESGETYLVHESGQLVTQSRFLKNPSHAPIPAGIGKHWMGIKKDYRNIKVLAVWQQVNFGEFKGYVVSEIDESEVLQPVGRLRTIIFGVSGLLMAIFLCFIPLISKLLSKNYERFREVSRVKSLAMIEGQEAERQRISYELHDDIGQMLTVLSLKVANANIMKSEMNNIILAVNSVSKQVKSISANLSTVVLSDLGLYEALSNNLEDIRQLAKQSNCEFSYFLQNDEALYKSLSDSVALAVYRIVQEATNNMLKHSNATVGSCSLKFDKNKLILDIEDNGVGFDQLLKHKTLGLTSMKLRTESQGGLWNLRTEPNNGIHIRAIFQGN